MDKPQVHHKATIISFEFRVYIANTRRKIKNWEPALCSFLFFSSDHWATQKQKNMRTHWMCWTCCLSSSCLSGSPEEEEEEEQPPFWVPARTQNTLTSHWSPSTSSSASEHLSHNLRGKRPHQILAFFFNRMLFSAVCCPWINHFMTVKHTYSQVIVEIYIKAVLEPFYS